MNLPYPFKSAHDVKPDLIGRIALVDEGGRVLAHLPLTTAHGIAPEGWGRGVYADSGDGYGFGSGYGFGFSSGEGRGK
jgi:hypothetical protein